MLNEQLTYDYTLKKKRRNHSNERSNKRLKTFVSKSKFEELPNELFYQIFSYLTDSELLTSFRLLTNDGRFDELILNRTRIHFRSIRRFQLVENRCLINPKIVRQIHLFNDDDTPGIINAFFSYYSFDLINSFPNLQNLVLDQPEQNDLIKLMKDFSHLQHLSIRLSTLVRMPSVVYTNLYSSISSSFHLKSLTIVDDPDEPIQLPEHLYFPSLRNLTFGSLTMFDVQRIIQSAPELDYFKFHLNSDQSTIPFEQNLRTKITRLDINGPGAEFESIENFLRQMKNLKSLKLICRGIHATVWECFIKEYLPNLIDFHFKFDIRQKNLILAEYQTDWWKNEKKWIVIHHPLSPVIYTIPLIDTKLILNARTAFRQEISKYSNEYFNIHQLILTLNPLGFKLCSSDEIYFPSVESLTLIDYKNSQKPISHLRTLINLINIRHLTIDHRMRGGTFLLLIKEMPQLNSLSGQDSAYSSITNKFQNEKVLAYFKSNIKRLTITPLKACQNLRYVSQLCVVFSHIHHLTLTIKSADDIWPWLRKLSDLRSATIFCRYGSFIDLINHKWFLNSTYELRSHQDLRLWIR